MVDSRRSLVGDVTCSLEEVTIYLDLPSSVLVHLVEVFRHKLDTKFVESQRVSEMASMCSGRRSRKEDVSSDKPHGGDSILGKIRFGALRMRFGCKIYHTLTKCTLR